MGSRVDLADALAGDMGVELGRGDTRMTEQLLNDPEVGAALEEVRRERVPERMGRDALGEPGSAGRRADGREGLLAGQPPAAIADEQWSAPDRLDVAEGEDGRPLVGQPARQPVERDLAHGHEPLLVAL